VIADQTSTTNVVTRIETILNTALKFHVNYSCLLIGDAGTKVEQEKQERKKEERMEHNAVLGTTQTQ